MSCSNFIFFIVDHWELSNIFKHRGNIIKHVKCYSNNGTDEGREMKTRKPTLRLQN